MSWYIRRKFVGTSARWTMSRRSYCSGEFNGFASFHTGSGFGDGDADGQHNVDNISEREGWGIRDYQIFQKGDGSGRAKT